MKFDVSLIKVATVPHKALEKPFAKAQPTTLRNLLGQVCPLCVIAQNSQPYTQQHFILGLDLIQDRIQSQASVILGRDLSDKPSLP